MIPKDQRFRHLERKVGALLLLAVAGLAAAIFFIGVEQDVFSDKFDLHFTVDSATGFSRGMPVKLSGFMIGRIKDLELTEEARVMVTLQINEKYGKWIRQDSRVKLVKEGVIGESVIDVTAGAEAATMLKNGDTIRYESSPTLDDVLEEVKKEITPVLYQLKNLVAYLDDPKGDVKLALRGLRQMTERLPQVREKVEALLSEVGGNVGDVKGAVVGLLDEANTRLKEIKPIVESADGIMNGVEDRLPKIADRSEEILAEVKKMTETMGRTLVEVEKMSVRIRGTVDESAPEIPGLIENASGAARSGREVLDSVKKVWPVRSHITEPGTVAPSDGYERPAAPKGTGSGNGR